jgi:hypothetical protein
MFFTASNLVHYLLARALVAVADVVDGHFMTLEAGRRNRNFKVILGPGMGLFVKQIKVLEEQSMVTMRRETECYQFARDYPDWAGLMPRMIDHDPLRHSLIVELIPAAKNLSEFHSRHGEYSVEAARLAGKALALYHRAVPHESLPPGQMGLFRKQVPWIFALREVPAKASGGLVELIACLQAHPQQLANMARLGQAWRFDGIIHGDMKWDNCLVFADGNDVLQLRIIDWEVVDIGDAAWDLAGLMQSYLGRWIYSVELAQATSLQQFLDHASIRIETMFAAIHALWQGYLDASLIARPDAYAFLLRCMEYAAARLVLTAFENVCYAPTMNEYAKKLLFLSQQIFHDPQEAASKLFGLTEKVVQ